MSEIMVPMEFNSRLSLMAINIADSVRDKYPKAVHFKKVKGELRKMGVFLNRNPNCIPVSFEYLKVKVITNNAECIAFILSGKCGGDELLITSKNKHLINNWYKTSYKPSTLAEWRNYYGDNWRQPIRPVHRVL